MDRRHAGRLTPHPLPPTINRNSLTRTPQGLPMLIARIVPAFALAVLIVAPAHAAADDDDQPKFPTVEEIEKLPTGLKATRTAKGDLRGKYKWYYKTTVTAVDDDVTIEEFGVFWFVDGKWVNGMSITGKPYGAAEFAEWYTCENAKIPKGKSFADPTNWSSGNELFAHESRWYYIGIDSKGRRVKGEAIVEHKAEIDPKKPKDPEPDESE
jgi:hypothetical protein